jgi:hypothetical protein
LLRLTIATVPERFLLETACRIHPGENTELSGLRQDDVLAVGQAERFRDGGSVEPAPRDGGEAGT